MSPEQRHRADLVDQMVATGRYTRAVAERILDRMPHALDPIPARVTESVEVTTGFGTKWTYALHKVAGGYTVTFRPVDVDARRKSGTGSTGGFISGTTLSGIPKVYRTQKEAYEAVVAHAGRGQYLLKKNPYRELEFRGMRRGMEAIPLKVVKAKSNVQAMGRSYAKHMEEADRADNLALKQKHRAKAFEVERDAGAFIEDIAEQVDESSQRQAKGILYSEFRAYSGMTRNPRTFRGVKRAGKKVAGSAPGKGRGKVDYKGWLGSAQRQRAELAYYKQMMPDLPKGFIESLDYNDLRGLLEERGVSEFRFTKSNPLGKTTRTAEQKERVKAIKDLYRSLERPSLADLMRQKKGLPPLRSGGTKAPSKKRR